MLINSLGLKGLTGHLMCEGVGWGRKERRNPRHLKLLVA